MKLLRTLAFIFSLSSILASSAHAQFEGVVFDPTQSAHAIQEIEQGEQQLQKWGMEMQKWEQHLLTQGQIFTTAVQTRNQIVTAYNLAYQMSRMHTISGSSHTFRITSSGAVTGRNPKPASISPSRTLRTIDAVRPAR